MKSEPNFTPPPASGPVTADPPALAQALARVRWVLVAPTHPGNVGASARALAVTGHEQLWLAEMASPDVAQAMLQDPQAQAMSAGADALLAQCQTGSLAQALAGTQISLALTARPREFEPRRLDLQSALALMAERLQEQPDAELAVVLGTERTGLSNEELLQCSHVCGLDVNPGFSSLNLSQALQLVAYGLRVAVRQQLALPSPQPSTTGAGRPSAVPATQDQVAGLHAHLMRVAELVGHYQPEAPGRMAERLSRLFARAGLLEDEVQMLRGLCTEIERSQGLATGRARRSSAAS